MSQDPGKKLQFTKPPLNVTDQIALLKEKGLIIPDESLAIHWLSHISYFRFKNYSYSFKDYQHLDGNYKADTTFELIRDLYSFDRRLKMILFEALENIEVSVKTQVSNIYSIEHGAFWYTDANYFFSEEERRMIIRNANTDEDIPTAFDHAAFMEDLEYNLEYPGEYFLEHYVKHYEPLHPPSWMMMEIITFSTLSRMFENLKPSDQKNELMKNFNLTKRQMVSWLHCFSFIRNKCAHHARLLYTHIRFAPALPKKKSRQFLNEADQVDNDTLYAVISCIQVLLKVCNNYSSFRENILKLVDDFPSIHFQELGFTTNWRDEPLWS